MDKPDELIAAWSKDKLDLLAKYLSAYSAIMHNQRERAGWLRSYAYIDAFASVGLYFDEIGMYVNGSPLVALECQPPFDRFWFIDQSANRLRNLQTSAASLVRGREVNYRRGDANQILVDEVIRDVPYRDYQRGLVFLDPYGLHVKWDTVRQLAHARSFDIFMNLSTMGIVRLLDANRLPSQQHQQTLADVIGDINWMGELYSRQIDLFGDEHASRRQLDHESVAAIYLSRVKSLFEYVSNPVVMKNTTGAPLYVLFLASHNRTAMRITNDIFKRYERLRVPGR
jgi:three-Cys-motif partner protein